MVHSAPQIPQAPPAKQKLGRVPPAVAVRVDLFIMGPMGVGRLVVLTMAITRSGRRSTAIRDGAPADEQRGRGRRRARPAGGYGGGARGMVTVMIIVVLLGLLVGGVVSPGVVVLIL